ncbi:PQ loop repeat-domain-containing protein [Jimgerdemannia flammicorona]|uniref:PQ loop repeat-domain-containing protein n=1 Tax=Jimgerdemannia flammicorona TaxID=994334 RepID=A0A433QQR3_9FUNG|nr:PQ loop repeat-domain-containing protein [Jimgerdemannia flammicorona]
MSPTACEPFHNGVPYIRWIYFLFGDCVYGSHEATSLLLGYTSICCWFNAQFPQIYENYKNGSVESLSLPFLINWMLGDLTNLTGCLLTNQLPFQYVFYTHIRPPPDVVVAYEPERMPLNTGATNLGGMHSANRTYTFPSDKGEETHKRSTSIVFFALLLFTFNEVQSPQLSSSGSAGHVTRALLAAPSEDELWLGLNSQTIGRIMAWACTVLYLTSRMPQIWKNWRRGSTDGLSIALFVFAALGNLTYTASIFTNPRATRKSLHESLPYILGAAGTLVFDLTIYIQWWYYHHLHRHSRRRGHDALIEEADPLIAMEQSRPPSPGPEGLLVVEGEEEEEDEEAVVGRIKTRGSM